MLWSPYTTGSLNRHKNTHTKRASDNRFHSCRLCPRQFLHLTQLQEHEISIHHLDLINTQPYCLKTSLENFPSTSSSSSTSTSNLASNTNAPELTLTTESVLNKNSNKLSTSQLIQFMENETLNNSNMMTSLASSSPQVMGQSNRVISSICSDSPSPSISSTNASLTNFYSLPTEAAQSLLPNFNFIQHLISGGTDLTNDQLKTGENGDNQINADDTKTNSSKMNNYSTESNSYTCTLCSNVLGSKTELDLHWGQHFLQQMSKF